MHCGSAFRTRTANSPTDRSRGLAAIPDCKIDLQSGFVQGHERRVLAFVLGLHVRDQDRSARLGLASDLKELRLADSLEIQRLGERKTNDGNPALIALIFNVHDDWRNARFELNASAERRNPTEL
jgi:hypothetical protein